jgi:hypothetical protein
MAALHMTTMWEDHHSMVLTVAGDLDHPPAGRPPTGRGCGRQLSADADARSRDHRR